MKRIVVVNDHQQQHNNKEIVVDNNNDNDINYNHSIKLNNKNKNKLQQHSKVVRQSFAIGGIDQDYIDWGMGTTVSGSSGKNYSILLMTIKCLILSSVTFF